jgi:hypothetical protein
MAQITRRVGLRVKHIEILFSRKEDIWEFHHIGAT